MSEADMWAELDAVYFLPERQPDDIDSMQFAARYKISESTALRRMRKQVELGEFEFVTVRDSSSATGKRLVIRKV